MEKIPKMMLFRKVTVAKLVVIFLKKTPMKRNTKTNSLIRQILFWNVYSNF